MCTRKNDSFGYVLAVPPPLSYCIFGKSLSEKSLFGKVTEKSVITMKNLSGSNWIEGLKCHISCTIIAK